MYRLNSDMSDMPRLSGKLSLSRQLGGQCVKGMNIFF